MLRLKGREGGQDREGKLLMRMLDGSYINICKCLRICICIFEFLLRRKGREGSEGLDTREGKLLMRMLRGSYMYLYMY